MIDRQATSPKYFAALLWALSFLFVLRVAAQAAQNWLPQSYLPPFHAFQGSNLPYWFLLSAQLAIIAVMFYYAWRVQRGELTPSLRAARILGVLGAIYLAGSVVRIAVGLLFDNAPAWFHAWISEIFHLVLAGYVLTICAWHFNRLRIGNAKGLAS